MLALATKTSTPRRARSASSSDFCSVYSLQTNRAFCARTSRGSSSSPPVGLGAHAEGRRLEHEEEPPLGFLPGLLARGQPAGRDEARDEHAPIGWRDLAGLGEEVADKEDLLFAAVGDVDFLHLAREQLARVGRLAAEAIEEPHGRAR
jgi:hypothetical protein